MHHALRGPLTACLPRTTCASSARLQRRALVRVPPTSGTPTFPLDPRVRKGDKVIVAMSGGVDSSVVLRLLAEHVRPSPSFLPSSPCPLDRLNTPR